VLLDFALRIRPRVSKPVPRVAQDGLACEVVQHDLARGVRVSASRGVTHTAPSKYHDEIISLVFIHTKYGEPIVIMVASEHFGALPC
jgi:hypothetical protein